MKKPTSETARAMRRAGLTPKPPLPTIDEAWLGLNRRTTAGLTALVMHLFRVAMRECGHQPTKHHPIYDGGIKHFKTECASCPFTISWLAPTEERTTLGLEGMKFTLDTVGLAGQCTHE